MAKRYRGSGPDDRSAEESGLDSAAGRRSLTMQLKRRRGGRRAGGEGAMHDTAQRGVSGPGGPLPHGGKIQESFGEHDISGIEAHVGGEAAEAAEDIGAEAYATGNDVAFSGAPDLHTAAHEAAHVVQQRGGVQLKGGVGQEGDAYERHADAVADKVVAGESAAPLLSQMAPAGAGAPAGGGVQRLQLRIKDDLEEAMDGWGTDEDAIYNRLRRATPEELRSVVTDSGLMSDLRDELNDGEMKRVLRLLNAPIKMKLELAMEGWGTDEAYIHSVLRQATPEQLASVAGDEALLSRIEGELSGEDLRSVLDRLPVPLSRKLEFAMRGWGTDEQYIYDSIHSAPIDQVIALSTDSAMLSALDGELSGGDLAECRATIARRLYNDAGLILEAFAVMATSDDEQRRDRLQRFGPYEEQKKLCDIVIVLTSDIEMAKQAFEIYWDVDVQTATTEDDDGNTVNPSAWDLGTLQAIHAQLKLLPEQDTRAGVWSALTRRPGGGGSMSSSGNFKIGENVDPSDRSMYGTGTRLTAQAASGATELQVEDAAVFSDGQTILVGGGATQEPATVSSTDEAAKKVTLDGGLTGTHAARSLVVPDDGTGMRNVSWLDAVVRHEIAHALDTALGGVREFKDLGGWSQGTDFSSWASAMGSPWRASDGTEVPGEDRSEIEDRIDEARGSDQLDLTDGLETDHPMVRFYDSGVPVIEAAKTAEFGKRFWTDPTRVPGFSGKRFSINCYYHRYQSYNDQVQTSRVRDYQIFSPAEFFAEIYTVFYEQAGSVPDEQLGALVPVSSWRQWIRRNVHERGHSPTEAEADGNTSPSVGAKSNNPGTDV